jgi:hypothetical protein
MGWETLGGSIGQSMAADIDAEKINSTDIVKHRLTRGITITPASLE